MNINFKNATFKDFEDPAGYNAFERASYFSKFLDYLNGEGRQLIFLIQVKENVGDIMRNPASVLNSLSKHSRILDYKFERLYRILFNEEMYYTAYQNIYAKAGNMTMTTL